MSAVFLSPGNRLVVVFGGGPVAYRKCLHFRGFRIRVVALEVMPEMAEIAESVVTADVSADFQGHMRDADIVVAATNDKELNWRIRDAAMSVGIPVNCAHGGGDLLIPSVLRRERYVVAVSTEGRVPAFPPYLVAELDRFLDARYDWMMDLLIKLRPVSKERLATQKERAEYLARVLYDEEITEMLGMGDAEAAERRALNLGGFL